jgi:hypothetical protein
VLMPQRNNVNTPLNKANIQLAIPAIQRDATLSQRCAAAIYKVSQSTFSMRLTGTFPRRNCTPNRRNLKTT